MADYTPIGDGELIADQPITQALMTRLRDNPIAIIERAAGAPTYGWTVTTTGSNANGYYRIWDDGFMQQWGYIAAPASSVTITFPVAFTDAASVDVQTILYKPGDTGGMDYCSVIRSIAISSFSLSHYTSGDGEFWRAQGY